MEKGEPIVVVKEVGKNYGTVEALKEVSFVVERGEIFGLIGPDGAGKSSLFRILTTLLLADKGTAMVAGLDVVTDYKQIRTKVGYMPGRFSLYQDLSVEENLEFFATVFHTTVQENYDLIKDIYQQIEPFRKRRAGALSGGMKQKLALSCALIHKPDILFLDEPTTGVDPVSRKEFWQMLRNLREQGITIVVSTPIMDEARQCDRIAFINHGQIHGIDTPELQASLKILFEKSAILLAQAFTPTEFDWRVGLLNGVPLYACKYYMAKGHWQIYCHYDSGRSRCGLVDTIPIYQVPRVVLDTAVKAANLIGKGLYGVDLKMVDDKAYVIEINDNPSIDHGLEDAIIGDEMYYRLLNHFEQVLETKHY